MIATGLLAFGWAAPFALDGDTVKDSKTKTMRLTVGTSQSTETRKFAALFKYFLEAHGARVLVLEDTDAVGKRFRSILQQDHPPDLSDYKIYLSVSGWNRAPKESTNGSGEGVEIR